MIPQDVTTQSVARQKMLPMILSIAGNLLLWTLGFTTMSVATENNRQRVDPEDAPKIVQEFPVDPSRVENLQRWVDSGHDTWCRSANLVAQATLQRFAPEFSATDLSLARLPIERKQLNRDKVIYTYHSLDGYTTYRITVVRYQQIAHSTVLKGARVWLPIRSEKITRARCQAGSICS
jgi:hypothetical protein